MRGGVQRHGRREAKKGEGVSCVPTLLPLASRRCFPTPRGRAGAQVLQRGEGGELRGHAASQVV